MKETGKTSDEIRVVLNVPVSTINKRCKIGGGENGSTQTYKSE